MPRWLANATKSWTRSSAPEPQPFEVDCACGQKNDGVREADFREIRCDRCGEWLFVLPVDVYPPLPRKKSRPLKPSSQQPGERASQTTPEPPAPPIPHPTAEIVEPSAPTQLPVERKKPRLTSFRMIMLVTVAVLGTTVYWRWHVHAREHAEQQFQTAREKAEAALQQRDFRTAALKFQSACEALDILGRDDALAQKIRQMLREATAASRLATQSLLTIIEEAHKTLSTPRTKAEGIQNAATDSLPLYAGQWIVMESTVISETDADGAMRNVIDFPLTVDGTTVVIDAEMGVFEPLMRDKRPKTIIFAAQLEGCRLTKTPQPTLWVDLRDESAFLWTSYENYSALGLQVDDPQMEQQLRRVLDAQARIVGVEP